jgi:hypothetical protein
LVRLDISFVVLLPSEWERNKGRVRKETKRENKLEKKYERLKRNGRIVRKMGMKYKKSRKTLKEGLRGRNEECKKERKRKR